MAFTIKIDTKQVQDHLKAVERELPGVTAKAVNSLAFDVQRAERDLIRDTFNNPRPFTQRSVLVDKATPTDPTATVYVRDEAARYITPYVFGGQHRMPSAVMLDPIKARIDSYGQMSRGAIERMKARPDTFIGTFRETPGLWQRIQAKAGQASGLKLLVRFLPNRDVDKRLPFHALAQTLVANGFSEAFGAAIDRMLRKK